LKGRKTGYSKRLLDDAVNTPEPWAAFEFGAKGVEQLRGRFGNGLDRPIGEIPNRARNPEPFRRADGEVAITHALYPA
jgi:hypothetical protein